MIDFTRNRSLREDFERLVVEKDSIYRLARLVGRLSAQFNSSNAFEITARDGEDTISTTNPEFFNSEFMPISPKTIRMSIGNHNSPISVQIDFGTHNTLRVNGDDPERVLGIFEELKREMRLLRPRGELITYLGGTFFGQFLLAILCAAFVFSIFDIGLSLSFEVFPDFKGSKAASTIALLGGALMLMSFAAGPMVIPGVIRKYYPPFEFTVTYGNPKFTQRIGLKTVAGLIVLPILINLVSAFIKDGIHLLL